MATRIKPHKETIQEQLQRLFNSVQHAISSDFVWQTFSDSDVNEIFNETLSELFDSITQAQTKILEMNAQTTENG